MKKSINELEEIARCCRIKIIKMLTEAGSGHPGGSLSAIDIITVLFYNFIKRTKENASSPDRDRFVLSKGHSVPAVYAIFSEIGLIDDNELMNLRKLGSRLQGHPDREVLHYLEAATGSLGQGLSIAQGMAIASKLNKIRNNIYCIIGDGEIQEGQIWEALMSAPKFKLDNLITFLDYNKGQIDGYVKDIMDIEPIRNKIISFNWDVYEIDGHDLEIIDRTTREAIEKKNGRPKFIIAHTIKGKGVSFMEDAVEWHGKTPNRAEEEKALSELVVSKKITVQPL